MLTPQSVEFEDFLKKLDLASVNQAALSANVLTVALHSALTHDLPINASGARRADETPSASHQGNFNRTGVKIQMGREIYMGLFVRPVGHPDNLAFNAMGKSIEEAVDHTDPLFEPVDEFCGTQKLWQQLMTTPDYAQACVLVENRLLHLDTSVPGQLLPTLKRPRL